MGKFQKIAILTDLDRTFLGSGSNVVARNVEAIEYFKSQGGAFSLSTGRMHYNLDRLITGVENLVNAPAILCNGTYLYDFGEGRVLAERFMEPMVSYEAVAFIRAHCPDIHARISRREGYLISADDPFSEEELVGYGIDVYEMVPFEKWDVERWYKLVLSGTPQSINRVEAELMQRFPHVFEYNRSRETTLEMQMKGTNKASLLDAFRGYYRGRGEERLVYVCGDYENDRAILKQADVSVCPSNALPSIKDVCQFCLGSNDDGLIADLVEMLDREM